MYVFSVMSPRNKIHFPSSSSQQATLVTWLKNLQQISPNQTVAAVRLINGCEDISTFSLWWTTPDQSRTMWLLFFRSSWVLDTLQMSVCCVIFNRELPHGGNYIWYASVKCNVTDWRHCWLCVDCPFCCSSARTCFMCDKLTEGSSHQKIHLEDPLQTAAASYSLNSCTAAFCPQLIKLKLFKGAICRFII